MLSTKYIEHFLEHKIKDNQTIALGTSDIAFKVIRELALKNALKSHCINVVPTSLEIAELCHHYNLKLADVNEKIDLAIEFASYVDNAHNFTKLSTHSLIRDKMIAYYAKELYVFVEASNVHNKLTEFPIEVSKFGLKRTMSALDLFGKARLRMEDGKPVKTLEQNYLIDLKTYDGYGYDDLEFKIKEIPGIIESGLFCGLADKVFVVDKKEISKRHDSTKRN